MATDVQPEFSILERQRSTSTAPAATPPAPHASQRAGRRWLPGIVVIGGLAALAIAAAFMLGAVSPDTSGPRLTHTIALQNLKVAVTGQGTLESSNNEEVRCKVKGANSTIVWIIENGTEVNPGDVLVRIDTSTIEDNISTQTIAYQNALATYAQSEGDVAVARTAITEYEEGTFRSELKTLEKDLAIATSNLRTAQNILEHSQKMVRKGYVTALELESNEYTVQHAELQLEVIRTDIDVLKRFTRTKTLEELQATLKAADAKLASDKAALDLEKARLDREQQQLENCVIRAATGGMAIYAEGDKYGDRPDIREGGTVREDQVLLLIPDLNQMQVKVGIHEAKIEQIKPGLPARIELQDRTYDGAVLTVASMAEPPGWWNGNMVKYQTVIKLNKQSNLKPGMSADVEIVLARHRDVPTIPVGALVEQQGTYLCWVKTDAGLQRRELDLGDSDDQFLVVNAGVKEGDEVVLNPLAYVEEAQTEALKPFSGVKSSEAEKGESEGDATVPPAKGKPPSQDAKPLAAQAQKAKAPDKNGDAVPTKDETSEPDGKNGARPSTTSVSRDAD